MTAYNFDGTSTQNPRSVYLAYTSKNGLNTKTTQVSQPGANNPILAPTGLDGGYLIWINGDNKFCYTTYSDGGSTGSIQTTTGAVSDCQPISYNGKAVWYVTNNSTPYFYTLDSSGLHVTKTDGSDTAPPASTAPSTPSAGTQAPATTSGTTGKTSFPDVPGAHWASTQIQRCMELGIVAGHDNGTFSLSVTVDVAQLNQLYGGDTSKATSMVFAMVCQNYQPGNSGLAGLGLRNYSRVTLALDGQGGVELQFGSPN